jgi:CRP-like cAMP-binding protein
MQTLDEMICSAPWAQALGADELERVRCDAIERRYEAGSAICRAGEPSGHWLGVIEGLVKASTVTADGRASTLLGYTAGAWFGEGALLRQELRRYNVVPLSTVRMALVPRTTFDWLMSGSLPFARFVARQLNDRLADFITRMEHERASPVDRHIAYCLAALHGGGVPGRQARVEMTQTDIGLLAARSRQQVNRALACLEEAGLLRRGYNSVTLLDVPGLLAYAQQSAGLPQPAASGTGPDPRRTTGSTRGAHGLVHRLA